MRLPPSHSYVDPDTVETLSPGELLPEAAMPVSDSWDSEAPTAVYTRRPVFARPPPLPQI